MKQARWGMRLLTLGICLFLSAMVKAQTKSQGSIKVRTEVIVIKCYCDGLPVMPKLGKA